MKTPQAMFSSLRTDWPTPWEFFRLCDAAHGPFTLDVCATEANAKCERYFSPEENGLIQPWSGVCWMNPPYGKAIPQWIAKAVLEVDAGHARRVVCLIPSRTDTVWWHELVQPHGLVRFVRGRIRFEGSTHSAPFPNALVIFEHSSSSIRNSHETADR